MDQFSQQKLLDEKYVTERPPCSVKGRNFDVSFLRILLDS